MNSFVIKYLLCCLGFFCLVGSARAQLTAPAGSSSTTAIPSVAGSVPDKASAQISQEAMIFDGPVNPHEYRMGPGDIVQYSSWTSNATLLLMVSADELL